MKKLLLIIFAAISIQNTAHAESIWLVIWADGIEKIEMENVIQCEEQGQKLKKERIWDKEFLYRCLIGK
tara:strand:- start:1092 stop:1298 length:207 start_codon:yes stop_codon:yes gene_type:complete